MTAKTQHSRLGIASVLLGIGVWGYFALLVVFFFRTDAFSKLEWIWERPKPQGQVTAGGFEGLVEMVLVLGLLFVAIPAVGHITGLVLAMAGCIQQKRKRLFAIIGFPINAMYFILVAMILLGARATMG
jgi:hypothetical protein